MAEDWATDVKKYHADADDDIIAGIVRYCGIALRNRDSALISFADGAETARVRENFLKKKLALTGSDEVLDACIADVGQRMKDDRTKNRVTAYYLLAHANDRLEIFRPKSKRTVVGLSPMTDADRVRDDDGEFDDDSVATASLTAMAGANDGPDLIGESADPLSRTADAPPAPPAPPPRADPRPATDLPVASERAPVGEPAMTEPEAAPPPSADIGKEPLGAAYQGDPEAVAAVSPASTRPDPEIRSGRTGWIWWLLLALVVLALLWWALAGRAAPESDDVPTSTQTAANG